MQGVEKNIRTTQTALKDVTKLLKLDPSNTELLSQKHRLLGEAIKENKEELKALKIASEQAAKTLKNYDAWKKAYDPIQKEIEETGKKITELKRKMAEMADAGEIDTDEYKELQAELEESTKCMRELRKSAKEVSEEFGNPISMKQYDALQREMIDKENTIKELERTAGSANATLANISARTGEFGEKAVSAGKAFLPLTAAVAAVGTASVSAATTIESAMTNVRKTVDTTEEGYEKLREAAEKMSATKAISQEEVLNVMSLGGQLGIAADSLEEFASVITDLDISTNLDSEEAATQLAQLANITGMSANEFSNFGNVLVALGNNSATTEADIMNMATRIAAAGSQCGMSEADILALSASLSSVGMEAEAGGSAISQVITQIDKNVALSSDNVQTWAETAGMSVNQFKQAWENDAAGALQNVLTGMSDVTAGGDNLNVLLEELGVTSIRQSDAMKRLAGNAEGMSDSFALANQEWSNGSAMADEAGKQYETTSSKIENARNSITNAAAAIGEILLPVVADIMESIQSLAEKFSNLPNGVQKAILVFAGIAAAVGPVLITIGKISTGISAVTGAFSKMSTIEKFIKPITNAVKGLFSLIAAHPVIAIITAIIAIVVVLYNKCEWFREGVNAVVSSVIGFFQNLWTNVHTIFTSIGTAISNAMTNIQTIITSAWNAILANPIVQAIITTIQTLFQNMVSTLQGIWTGLVSIAAGVWELIKNAVLGPVLLLIDLVTGDFEQLKSDALNIWNNIMSAAKSIWNGIVTIIKSYVTGGVNNVKTLFTGMKSAISSIWNGIKGTTLNVVNSIKTTAVNGFRSMVSGIKSAVSNISSAVINGFNGAISFITSLPGKAAQWGRDFIDGLVSGIRGAVGKVKDAVSNVADTIRSFLHFSRPDEGPLHVYEQWMPDFMEGLAKGIYTNIPIVEKAASAVAKSIDYGVMKDSPAQNIDYNKLYRSVKNGAADSSTVLYIGDREFKRVLTGMGVVFK